MAAARNALASIDPILLGCGTLRSTIGAGLGAVVPRAGATSAICRVGRGTPLATRGFMSIKPASVFSIAILAACSSTDHGDDDEDVPALTCDHDAHELPVVTH